MGGAASIYDNGTETRLTESEIREQLDIQWTDAMSERFRSTAAKEEDGKVSASDVKKFIDAEKDPFRDVEEEVQWKWLCDDVEESMSLCEQDVSLEGSRVVARSFSDGPSVVNLSDSDLGSKISSESVVLRHVVSLDLSGNALELVSLRFVPNCRSLNVSGNPIAENSLKTSLLKSECARHLLALDVSFVCLSENTIDFRVATPRLRRCDLENCDLTSVPNLPVTLIELNISDNKIESIEGFSALNSLSALRLFEGRGNILEKASRASYRDAIRSKLDSLEIMDGFAIEASSAGNSDRKHIGVPISATKPLSAVDGIREAVQSTETVADDMDFSKDKCSCLEGNPCISKYVCKDWDHRFDVARCVRLRKGMRDLEGNIT
eukprot:g3182.t1